MHTNKPSVGGLIGVHVSSIEKWVYQDNFEPVYLFIYLQKGFEYKKAPKRKTNDFYPLRHFCAHKKCGLCCLVFFFLLVDFCLWRVFVGSKSHRKKLHYTTTLFIYRLQQKYRFTLLLWCSSTSIFGCFLCTIIEK